MSPEGQVLAIGSVGGEKADFAAMLAGACPAEDGWRITRDSLSEPLWLSVEPAGAEIPAQGWKLHVSADAVSAAETLECVLPVLVGGRVSFKVTATQDVLSWLNSGAAGRSQVGKFVTVYPADEGQAVRLAEALIAATSERLGPAIPSDRRFGKHSVVQYRYGTLKARWLRTPLGEFVEVLTAPDGTLARDGRSTRFRPPDWVEDPFVAAGLPVGDPDGLVLAGRFLRTATLYLSSATLVVLAGDLEVGGTCVVKKSGRYFAHDLLAEAEVLRRLPLESTRPELLDVVESDGDVLLVLEDIAGETLDVVIRRALIAGETGLVIDWGSQLARALSTIHGEGLVFADLAPRNVLATPGGSLRLIDYTLSGPPTLETLEFGGGTVGYASPEQLAADGRAVEDDVHGLGAILHVALSGVPPVPAAGGDEPVRRLHRLVPGVNDNLTRVVGRCLAPTRANRYRDMREVEEALAGVVGPAVESPPWGTATVAVPWREARTRALQLALALGDRICDDATFSDDGAWWNGPVASSLGRRYRDLNAGDAGIVIALAELVRSGRKERHTEVLRAAAAALAHGPEEPTPLPGLYVGESGVGLALISAARITGDNALIEAAARRSEIVRRFPHVSPDLFNGSAGRLWFHLELHAASGDPLELEAAIGAGSFLLETAEETLGSGLGWRMPDGYDSLSGKLGLGNAHGAAGVADALLDLFDATGDERYLGASTRVGQLLASAAVPIADGTGMQWPEHIGEEPLWACWCVGAGGIGRFLRRLASYDALESGRLLAERAAWSVARTTRWTEPIQCHGLAGNAELLIDAYAATGDVAYLREASSLAELLEDAVTVHIEGNGEHSYLSGSAGLLTTLVRLADPESSRHAIRPNLLAPKGAP